MHEIKTLRKHQKTSTSRALRCDDPPPHPRVDISTLAKVGGGYSRRTYPGTLGRFPMRPERRTTGDPQRVRTPLQNRRRWRQISSPPLPKLADLRGTTARPTRRVRRKGATTSPTLRPVARHDRRPAVPCFETVVS